MVSIVLLQIEDYKSGIERLSNGLAELRGHYDAMRSELKYTLQLLSDARTERDMARADLADLMEACAPNEGSNMTFEKLPAVEGSIACLTCGCGSHDTLELDRPIGVGFGSAGYSRDGETLWEEGMRDPDSEEPYPTAQEVENMAKAEPDRDWRIFYYAPLYESEYQRQGDGHWVLVREGMGFA